MQSYTSYMHNAYVELPSYTGTECLCSICSFVLRGMQRFVRLLTIQLHKRIAA